MAWRWCGCPCPVPTGDPQTFPPRKQGEKRDLRLVGLWNLQTLNEKGIKQEKKLVGFWNLPTWRWSSCPSSAPAWPSASPRCSPPAPSHRQRTDVGETKKKSQRFVKLSCVHIFLLLAALQVPDLYQWSQFNAVSVKGRCAWKKVVFYGRTVQRTPHKWTN